MDVEDGKGRAWMWGRNEQRQGVDVDDGKGRAWIWRRGGSKHEIAGAVCVRGR